MSALSERIAAVLAIDPEAHALEYEGRWWTWADLAATASQVARAVPGPGAQVAVLLRNRPVCVAFVLGVLLADGCVVTVNPGRGAARTRADLADLAPPMILGTSDDVATLVPEGDPATVGVADELATPLEITKGTRPVGTGRPGVAVRMLTSGTTGPPKRVDLTFATLERVLVGASHYGATHGDELVLRRGIAVVTSPLVHLGGIFRVLTCVTDGRSFAFLDRFTVEGWLDAVRRHRPATASLVPAALRMVLEADPDPTELSSLRSVVSGTAPLDPDDADEFTRRYGVPVLISYAATEFGGAIAGWNLADHREFWAAKRGSVGRVHPGSSIRVVDPADGSVLGPDQPGVLEVRAVQLGDGPWVRTTDEARIDADGFLFILGRADHAIIRGGFKVLPDDVRRAIERIDGVRAAAVVGLDHARLGAVPVALVEAGRRGDVDPERIGTELERVLSPYERPVRIDVVDALPRTDSGKVDLRAVAAYFAGAEGRS